MALTPTDDHGAFSSVIQQVCQVWPEHRRFLDKSTREAGPWTDHLAGSVLRIAGDNLARVIEGYRWMCGMMLEEELFFFGVMAPIVALLLPR